MPIFSKALDWLGLLPLKADQKHSHSYDGQGHAESHGHTHCMIDPSIVTTERGIWALKWSFLLLAITVVLHVFVMIASGSVALIADGYQARTNGLTNLAVVAGAIGVWLGYSLADPIVRLNVTVAILGIDWQSGKDVLTRMLDGVGSVVDAKARWLGHRLHADVSILVDSALSVSETDAAGGNLKAELFQHIPNLSTVNVRAQESSQSDTRINSNSRVEARDRVEKRR